MNRLRKNSKSRSCATSTSQPRFNKPQRNHQQVDCLSPITGGPSKQDQIVLEKIENYIGFRVYRGIYLLWSPVARTRAQSTAVPSENESGLDCTKHTRQYAISRSGLSVIKSFRFGRCSLEVRLEIPPYVYSTCILRCARFATDQLRLLHFIPCW